MILRSRRRYRRRSLTCDVSELREQHSSLTSTSPGRRVSRIAVGCSYAIHGVIFELDDGTRLGKLVGYDGMDMDLYQDKAFGTTYVSWIVLEEDDSIEEVEFVATDKKQFLVHSIVFRTRLRELRFHRRNPFLAAKNVGSYRAVDGRPIVEVSVNEGEIHAFLTDRAYHPERCTSSSSFPKALPQALDDERKALLVPSQKAKDVIPPPFSQPPLASAQRTRSRSPHTSNTGNANSTAALATALAPNELTDANLRRLSVEDLIISVYKVGATNGEVDKAEEHLKKNGHREALIALFHYKQQEKELRNLSQAGLHRKATTFGVDQESLDSAQDADAKEIKAKMIKLILSKVDHLYSRKCPGKCGFVATWHETHCCRKCLKGDGQGPLCDRRNNFIEAFLDPDCIDAKATTATDGFDHSYSQTLDEADELEKMKQRAEDAEARLVACEKKMKQRAEDAEARLASYEKKVESLEAASGWEAFEQHQAELETWKQHSSQKDMLLLAKPNLMPRVQDTLQLFVHDSGDCAKGRGIVISSVQEVVNVRLWKQYSHYRDLVKHKLHNRSTCRWAWREAPPTEQSCNAFPWMTFEKRANEVLLLHGTTNEKAEKITREGFDDRLSSRGLHGRGLYLTTDFCKALQYCDNSSTKCIVVARVVLGDFFIAQGPMKTHDRPPDVEGCGDSHDSTMVRPGTPKGKGKGKGKKKQVHWEFVVSRDLQIYPELLIRFEE